MTSQEWAFHAAMRKTDSITQFFLHGQYQLRRSVAVRSRRSNPNMVPQSLEIGTVSAGSFYLQAMDWIIQTERSSAASSFPQNELPPYQLCERRVDLLLV